MRKLIIVIALLLGVWFFISWQTELENALQTFRRGDWRFFSLAAIILLLWLVTVAATYRVLYHALGIQERIEQLLLAAAAANFVNVIAPSGGVGGMTIFISQAKKRGNSAGNVTLANVLFIFFEYIGFLCVLAIGLFVLFRRNNLQPTEITASAMMLLMAAGLAALLVLGLRSTEGLARALHWLAEQLNRIARPIMGRNLLSPERAHDFAGEIAAGLQRFRENPRNLIPPFLLAMVNKGLLFTIFFLMFLAFQVPYSPGTLIAGFSIGYLFTVISPTPGGIGVMEGVLTLALNSMYIPLGTAAVITLAYRGITFWLPLALGMLALRQFERTL